MSPFTFSSLFFVTAAFFATRSAAQWAETPKMPGARAQLPRAQSLEAMTITALPQCTGCVLQALSPEVLEYSQTGPNSVVDVTVTQTVLYHTFVYSNGSSSTSTEIESLTDTPVDITSTIGATAGATGNVTKYASDLTWTWSGLTLTYPTTYFVFTDLNGGLERLDAEGTLGYDCASNPTSLARPEPKGPSDLRKYVFPSTTSWSSIMSLPSPLVQYLEQQPQWTTAFSGVDLSSCTTAELSQFATITPYYNGILPRSDSNSTTNTTVQSSSEFTIVPPPASTTALPSTVPSASEVDQHTTALYLTQVPRNLPPTTISATGKAPDVSTDVVVSQSSTEKATDTLGGIKPTAGTDPETSSGSGETGSGPTSDAGGVDPPSTAIAGSEPSANQGSLTSSATSTGIGSFGGSGPQSSQASAGKSSPSRAIASNTIAQSDAPGGQAGSASQQIHVSSGEVPSNEITPSASPQEIQIGGQTVQVTPATTGPGIVIGTSVTLQPGHATTYNGVPVSVQPGGSQVVVDDSSTVVIYTNTGSGRGASEQTVVVDDQSLAVTPVASGSAIVLGSQTVSEGQVATVNGVAVSVAPGGSNIVIGDNTVPMTHTAGPGSSPVLIIGNSPITAQSDGGFIIASGSTLFAGGPALTIDGTILSLASSSNIAIINGATQTIGGAVPTGPSAPVLQAGKKQITANVADGTTQYILAPGKTLTPGGVLTVSGATYSLDQVGGIAVVNGVTQTISEAQSTAAPVVTIGGQPVTAQVAGGTTQFVLGRGKTLTPGGVATVSGTTYSLPITGSAIVINGATSTFAKPSSITQPPELTIDGQGHPVTTVSGTAQIVIGPGTTLVAGSVVTISGNTYSLPASQSPQIVLINGVTSVLGFATTAAPLTIAGSTIAPDVADGVTEYVLGPGATLTHGGSVVYSGTTYNLPASGSYLVVNGATSTIGASGIVITPPPMYASGRTYLPHVSGTSTWYVVDGKTLVPSETGTITAAPVLTIAGHTYAPTIAGTSTWYLVDGTTLNPGGIATIHGTTLSLDSSASVLIIDGTTSTVHTTAASRTGKAAVTSQTSDTGGYVKATSATSSKGGSQALTPISVTSWIESWLIGAAGLLLALL